MILRAVCSAIATLCFIPVASAYQIDTVFTTGCHERISIAGLDAADWPSLVENASPGDDDPQILDDLPFSLPATRRDIATATLLIGNRHNDIEGEDPINVTALTEIHNPDENQRAHCLRDADDDDAAGDETALAECREFILGEIRAALGTGEQPDFNAREEVQVFLTFRGKIDLDLPRHAFHMGKALHALQDSYTHAIRNPSDGRVRHVLNWVEGNLSAPYDIDRDGFEHINALDDCSSKNPRIRANELRSEDASASLLAAVYADATDVDERLVRAEAALDVIFEREEGCVFANDYCDAEEIGLASGCASGDAKPSWAFLVVFLLALGLRKARRMPQPRWPMAASRRVHTGVFCLAIMTAPALASANTDTHLGVEEVPRTLGLSASVGGSIDRGALAFAGGLRWNPSERIGLGFDVEYNPWISLSVGEYEHGTLNFFVPATFVWSGSGNWKLHSTLGAGASVLLSELVGAEKLSTGIFAKVSPLGVSLPMSSGTRLTINPGEIAFAAPQLTGIPFIYLQYRATIGIEWYGM